MKRLLLILLLFPVFTLSAQGPCDHALSFSGFNSYVDCGPGANYHAEGQLTLEAWINLPNVITNQKIAGNIDPFTNSGFELGIENGGIYCEVKDTLGLHTFTAGNVPAGAWTHIAMTYRVGGSFKGYVNGNLVADVPATNQPIGDNGTTNFRIGVAPWDPNYFGANGQIDEVRVWDVERSQSKLRENMRIEQIPPVSGLIGYWKFSEGIGNTTADASGYNHNGVRSGTNLPSWQTAVGPYGFGAADLRVGTGVMGLLDFPSAGAGIMSNITPTSDTFVVSKIDCEPGGTQPVGAAVFNNGYWIVDRYGSATPLSVALDFHFPAGTVSAADSLLPSNLLLYNRSGFSTAGWINNAFGGAASPSNATVTFPFVNVTGQFKVGTNGSSTLGLNSLVSHNGQPSLYPNPARTGTTISVKSQMSAGVLEILDAAGRVIRSAAPSESTIVTSGLAPGTYHVVLQSQGVRAISRLVITE